MVEQGSDAPEVFSSGVLGKVVPITILGVVVYGGMLVYGDAGAMSRLISQAPSSFLLEGLTLSFASFAVRGVRWLYYLKVSRIHVPTPDALVVCMAGFAMSITPAKMGEVLKALLLKQVYGVPVARSASLVVAERVTDLIGLLLLGGLGLLAVPGAGFGAFLGVAAAVGVLLAVANKRLGLFAISVLARVPIFRRLHDKLTDAYLTLLEVLRPLPFMVGVTLAFIAWGLQCLCVSVLAVAFRPEGVALGIACVSYAAPLLAGTLALIPGGLGLTEASMTGALQEFAGLAPDVSTVITLLVRLVTFWFAIALGFLALAVWRRRHPPNQRSMARTQTSTPSSRQASAR